MTSYESILVEPAASDSRVGIITLNRPSALNALNHQLMTEVVHAATAFDTDPGVGCIIITGSDRAFAAGADIKELQSQTFPGVYSDDLFRDWDRLTDIRIPIVAAVAGHALGGGCELAMLCDILIAADNATFGQPEIQLGVIPGFGGTQRLTRAVGKAKAMDLVLSGRMMSVDEAERSGLVSRVVPLAELLPEAIRVASKIAGMSAPIAIMAKESVNRSFESSLAEGLRFERRLNHSTFATADQKEGMSAFREKRPAEFIHR